jgi:hypothetical protein
MATTRKPSKPSKPTRPTKPDPLTHQTGSHHGETHDGEHGDPHVDGQEGREGGANITLTIRLGPMVSFQIEGRNCTEITSALRGFEHLNRTVDAMFSDLAKRVYPDLGQTGKAAD